MNTCLFGKALIERTEIVSEHLTERDWAAQRSTITCLTETIALNRLTTLTPSTNCQAHRAPLRPIVGQVGGRRHGSKGTRWQVCHPIDTRCRSRDCRSPLAIAGRDHPVGFGATEVD